MRLRCGRPGGGRCSDGSEPVACTSVNRRVLSILLPCSIAALVSGCATFSETDVVARVGDTELSVEQLDELIEAVAGGDPAAAGALPEGVDDANVARQQISAWIFETSLGLSDEEVEESYALGLIDSGVTCPKVMVTPTFEEAQLAETRLAAGEPFGAVLAELNIDPSLAESSGAIGCITLEQIDLTGQPSPDIQAILDINAANPISVQEIPIPDGTLAGLLVQHTPFEELAAADSASVVSNIEFQAAQGLDVDDLDVYVDPRYGAFDAATGAVIALR